MKRTARHAPGCLCFDKRRGQWRLYWYEARRRRSKVIGTRQQYPTKAAAWKAVENQPPSAAGDAARRYDGSFDPAIRERTNPDTTFDPPRLQVVSPYPHRPTVGQHVYFRGATARSGVVAALSGSESQDKITSPQSHARSL
jgi:hypothetical protein